MVLHAGQPLNMLTNLCAASPDVSHVAGQVDLGPVGRHVCSEVLDSISPSMQLAHVSPRIHMSPFGDWVKYRVEIMRRPGFTVDNSNSLLFAQLLDYYAYVFTVLGLQHTTIASHLPAVKFFHRLSRRGGARHGASAASLLLDE